MAQPVTRYGIIPARYASTRFPGKPLADLLGHPMFRHVYERACLARAPEDATQPLLKAVLIATDDERIRDAAEKAGVPCVMTSPDHASGTDRVCEAARRIGVEPDAVVVNIQGDEPVLDPRMLEELVSPFSDPDVRVSTLASPIPATRAASSNQVKVVVGAGGDALYFSRAMIPFDRDGDNGVGKEPLLGHVGLYAFRMETLERFVSLPPSRLERLERLEQLRLLENGIPIRVVTTSRRSYGVDTPEDLETVRAMLAQEQFAAADRRER